MTLLSGCAAVLVLVLLALARLLSHWRARRLLDQIPDGAFAIGPTTRERLLKDSKQFCLDNYDRHTKHGRMYKYPNALGGYKVVLPAHRLREIKLAGGEDTLSWRKVMHDVLAISYTGSPDRASFSAKVLRTQVTRRLDLLAVSMTEGIDDYFDQTLPQPGQPERSVQLAKMFVECVARITIGIFCGSELAADAEWVDACLQMTVDAWAAGSEIRAQRGFVARTYQSFVNPKVKRMAAHKDLTRRKIGPIWAERRRNMKHNPDYKAPDDGFQWLLEGGGDQVSFEVFVQTLMRVMMAALHTTAGMATLAFADLLYRPKYKAELIQELQQHLVPAGADGAAQRHACEHLRKLDSFIKESARFNPIGLNLAGRKVSGRPHVFADGTTIPPGNTLFAPCYAILHDPSVYPDPHEFRPWRFSQGAAGTDPRWLLAHASEESLNFGYGAQACPGRCFASQELKLMFARLLLGYETRWDGARNGSAAPLGAYVEQSLQSPRRWHMLVRRKDAAADAALS